MPTASLCPHHLARAWHLVDAKEQMLVPSSLFLSEGREGSGPAVSLCSEPSSGDHLERTMRSPSMEGDATSLSSVSAAAAVKLLQSCPILCDPIDGSPPSSSIPGILQARTLEWVAISFSNA